MADTLDDKTVAKIVEWVAMDRGNVEKTARWMARRLKMAGVRECRRWIAEALVIDAYAQVGADARVDIDGFDTMTAEQLRDQLVYLGDFQG